MYNTDTICESNVFPCEFPMSVSISYSEHDVRVVARGGVKVVQPPSEFPIFMQA